MKTYALHIIFTVIDIFFLSILYPSAGNSQTFQFEGNRTKQTISFKIAQNLIIIPVYIDGKGPYNFLLDTGVGQMIITDTSFLRNYNIKKFQKVKVQGYGLGESIEAILTRDLEIRVGKATISHMPAAIFTQDIFNLSNYLGVRIYGILGYYFFNSFLVKINYSRNSLTMYKPGSTVKIKGKKIPIEIRNTKPYITAELQTKGLGNINLDMLIDNGSSHPMTLETFEKNPFPLPENKISANLGVGINGIINGSIGRVDKIKIGDFEFNNVLVGFPEFNKKIALMEGNNRNGSIGADILKHFTVTFDYLNGFIYLKKNYTTDPTFEHDMSGLEVYVIEKNKTDRYFIGRIESGSPGEEAGLKTDDEIAGIDFRPAQAYKLSDLTELFKSNDGRKMILEIIRGKERFLMFLQLKRRI